MSKFSKILIVGFLILSVSVVFGVFHFSKAQNGESNVSASETSNLDLIDLQNSTSTPEGTVYICPQATSLEEINPRCPEKIILKLGETINGLTLTTTNYQGQDYYLVLGFENGGGAVNLPPKAQANGPYQGYAGLPITFDASSSTDPNNDPLEYRWDFDNDGIWDTDWLKVPTIEHIWNNDYDGIIKLEVSDGESTSSATSSVKVISPRTLKKEVISELEKAKTGNKKTDKKIDKIIWLINQSLDENLWQDVSHLVSFEKSEDLDKIKEKEPKFGIKVFHDEKVAVRLMMPKPGFEEEGEDFKDWKIPEELKPVFEAVIEKLIKADQILAQVLIYDAKNISVQNPKFQKIVAKQIEMAEKEIIRAEKELKEGRPDKAIMRFAKAWLHSQLAIKFANI